MDLKFRQSDADDKANLALWLASDQYHSGQNVENWTAPNGDLTTFYDEDGSLFTVRLEHAIRIHFQHNTDLPTDRRLAEAMSKGIEIVKDSARQHGVRELIFRSDAESLIRFFDKRGFKPSQEFIAQIL
jgi:hypothetical protein